MPEADDNTGIYRTSPDAARLHDEDLAAMFDEEEPPTAVDVMLELEHELAAFKRRINCEFSHGPPESREDCLRASLEVKRAEQWMQLLRKHAAAGRDVTFHAVRIGGHLERAQVRMVEYFARKGRAVVLPGKVARQESQRRDQRLRDIVAQYRRDHPGVSQNAACTATAKLSRGTDFEFTVGAVRKAHEAKRKK